MFYVGFVSASKKYISWLRDEIFSQLGIKGHITIGKSKSVYYQLKYAKKEGFILLKKMFYRNRVVCLSRKRLKVEKTLSIVGKYLQ